MEGDTYEMEDQRNWTDASYKTYVRPLAYPGPTASSRANASPDDHRHAVRHAIADERPVAAVRIERGASVGTVPPLGLGLRPEHMSDALDQIDALKALAPAYLVLHHDPTGRA